VAYDRLGFGRSTKREALPSINFIREEAETSFPAVCEAAGIESFDLLGYSVGGGMACTIAAMHPQACASVITIAAQAFIEDRTLEGIRAAREMYDNERLFAKLTRWHGEKAAWALDAWTRVWLDPAMADWSLADVLSHVRCPVLVMHGGEDEFGSAAFPQMIADGVAGPSTMVVFEGCGHMPHRERRAEVLECIASFRKQHATINSGEAADTVVDRATH
jgi:pimeloyl-ACP methyl ester carboxylesterase